MASALTEREVITLRGLARSLEERGLSEESATIWQIVNASRRDELSASAAARILHVTPRIVRNWIKFGNLDGRIDATGRAYVPLSALMPVIEMDAVMPLRAESEPEITEAEILAEIEAYRAEQRAKCELSQSPV